MWGNDSWATMPLTTKGSREILIGIEVDIITADFPLIDIQEATAEIKASKPLDNHLQSLSVPKTVGGKVDVLLGIQYSCHHPKLVHQLESGLAIYELRLIADSPVITAAIAGPHHSFNMMLQKVGDVGTMLAAFADGMSHWRHHGPPPPQSLPLTSEEMELAVAFNKSEMKGIRNSSDYDDDTDLTPSTTCATSLSPIRSTRVPINPPAPKKVPKYRDRLRTDTRDNFLEPGNPTTKMGEQDCDCSENNDETNGGGNCQTMNCSYCPDTVTETQSLQPALSGQGPCPHVKPTR